MSARNESTSATCPRHIWMHEVLCAAGMGVEQAQPYRDRMNRAYNAGEPVWMMAEELRFKQSTLLPTSKAAETAAPQCECGHALSAHTKWGALAGVCGYCIDKVTGRIGCRRRVAS